MAFQLPATYTAPSTTSGSPLFTVDLPSRETTSRSAQSKAGTIRFDPKGHRIRIKLPPSPSPSTTQWTLDTPETDDDDDNDLSFAGSDSDYSSDDEESEGLSDDNRDGLSNDGDETRDDSGKELSDEDGEESSDDGGEFDEEISEEEVASLLLEAKDASMPISIPYIAATPPSDTVAAKQDDKDGKKKFQAYFTGESGTAGKRDDPPAALAPTASKNPPLFKFQITKPVGMSLANHLLFNDVFKIQETGREGYICRYLDAQGAQCKCSVPSCHSLSIKLVENSLSTVDGIKVQDIRSLAIYSMCETHTNQSGKLAGEWIWLAQLTRYARKFWLNQQKSLSVESQALKKVFAELATAEVRRLLAQDEIAVRVEKEKTKLYNESQKIITSLRMKIDNIESEVSSAKGLQESSKKILKEHLDKISAPEEQMSHLTTDNFARLKEARESAEDALVKERERHRNNLVEVNGLYKESQETVEALRKEMSSLTFEVSELTAEKSSLQENQEAKEDALVKERGRSQQDLQEAKELYEGSQTTVEALRKEISTLTSKIGELMTENSSLKEGQEVTEDTLVEERKRGQQDLQDARDLYKGSQEVVEALRKEADALTSRIGELTTEESSLRNSIESTQVALTKEKVHSRELEIRLEERVALGSKTQDSHETKLEKYLREELDKSQRRVLQQQNDFEKMRDNHVQLQITNATLESQVKQIEAVKEDLGRASRKDVQELSERNAVLSDQLHHTSAQFEQLKAGLAAMEKENGGEASKSKFSLRDIYRRQKQHESSRLLTPPTEQ